MATVAERQADANGRAGRRARRYGTLEYWRSHTSRHGGRFCMFALNREVRVAGTADGTSHVSGVRRCGSPWICGQCTPTIREGRAGEIDQGVSEHLARGGSAWLVSSTFAHELGDDLGELMVMGQRAHSRTWALTRKQKADAGYVGQIRAWDSTYGRNGWHPHFHTIVLMDGDTARASVWLHNWMGARWGHQVEAAGGRTDVTSKRSPGWDVRRVRDSAGLSDYLCKVEGGWGAGLEVARADVKRGNGKGCTIASLLELAQAGDRKALDLCRQYERATSGKRAIVWGRGLKASLGLDETTDDELAAVTPAGVVTVECVLPAKAWRRLLMSGEAAELVHAVGLLAAGLDDGRCWRWPAGWLLAWRRSSAIPIAA